MLGSVEIISYFICYKVDQLVIAVIYQYLHNLVFHNESLRMMNMQIILKIRYIENKTAHAI